MAKAVQSALIFCEGTTQVRLEPKSRLRECTKRLRPLVEVRIRDLDFYYADQRCVCRTFCTFSVELIPGHRSAYFMSSAFLPLLERGHKSIRGYTSSMYALLFAAFISV